MFDLQKDFVKPEVGKIYRSPHFIFLYGSKKDAARWIGTMEGWRTNTEADLRHSALVRNLSKEDVQTEADFMSFDTGVKANVISPKENIFVVERRRLYKKYRADGRYKPHNVSQAALVIVEEKIGWILIRDWMDFKLLKIKDK